jgi:hypothetical protein
MVPIRQGDGTGLAPSGYAEVRKGDGTVLYSGAIPDSALAHRYDATEIAGSDGDTVSTWTDQEGTADLTAGTAPTLKTGSNGINSKNVVLFDGTDDFLNETSVDLAQPLHIFLAFRLETASQDGYYLDGDTNRVTLLTQDPEDDYGLNAGTRLTGGSTDTDPHIQTALPNGASSTNRLDGTQIASGDAGANNLTDLRVGSAIGNQLHAHISIGEILIYDTELSDADRNDVESYLSDKWGVTI